VQDALAGGAKLDELPGGLGLLAVTGTLDATGKTPDGTPAPIPGPAALRDAVIKRAFAVSPGDQPTLEDGPDHSFLAVSVDSITPPQQQPFEAVKDQVREDWLRDQRRREQNLVATGLLTAVNGGATLQAAAAAAHVAVTASPPISRGRPPPGVPSQLVQPVFATGIGHATMVETPTGFVVAMPLTDTKPDPAANPAAVDQVRAQLTQSASNDLEITYATALRAKAKVTVNSAVFDEVAR
jgi:peptidyl-prolyl cis-trans isomerase D